MKNINNKGDFGNTPFLTVLSVALILAVVSLSFASIVNQGSITYNRTITDTTYNNISAAGASMNNLINSSSQTYFGNNSITSSTSAVDRLINTGYNTILVLGSAPAVYETSIYALSSMLGIDYNIANFMVSFIMIIILTTAIFLAVGRGR